ncbi:hypothetical protein CYLTODRAFT_421959 [Cylindrobasidium torrendii FP15055 ss-10]|uniref:Arrestin C-terminal-like domain-containing protein n=1 Tax=Cylindrobasidium torrendii FP15055 ss-10 TaxID=1314674 RepID=A0A0D7BES0_9AGAR|nr:hypothetical protein CYLTODRAFT_421959 [Cylindrobasidium torrendii FP15055 ss-10]
MPGSKKNDVTIRLTESAVFLRADDSSTRSRLPDTRSSLLRGLLMLELVKPTKISSVELKLQAVSAMGWPEGFGARRADVSETEKLFSISSTLYDAADSSTKRRASLGPGVSYVNEDIAKDWEDDSINLPRARSRAAVRELERGRPRTREVTTGPVEDLNDVDIPPYSLHPPPAASSSSFHASASGSSNSSTISPSHSSGHLETVDEYPGFHSAPHTPHILSAASSIRSFRGDRSSSRNVGDYADTPPSGPSTAQNSPILSTIPLPGDNPRSPSESRGRRKSARFSLTSVLEAVAPPFSRSREREPSVDNASRGRPRVKNVASANEIPRAIGSKERKSHIFGDIFHDDEKGKTEGDGWKEFGPGLYTYPISFAIPGNAPPTLQTNYGSVKWTLRAVVHRPGAFTTKLETEREVIVVSCPTEEDTEDTENIIVERHWDQQLQYLITVSGRSFYIGDTIPISLTFMPLNKVKLHRLTISIEEKIEYHSAHTKKLARAEPANSVVLLSVRHEAKDGPAILPLESADPEAFMNSPLRLLVNPDDDISELASNAMGPGPWTFQQRLALPTSCKTLHFTNKNKKSNIIINHNLKIVMRVESGDPEAIDPKTGKKKLYDIVVQTPIHILSCRCNPEWTNLPNYTRSFDDPAKIVHQCPCQLPGKTLPLAKTSTRSSSDSDSGASAVETALVDPTRMRSLRTVDSVVGRSDLYERLISGQEGVSGEAPPAYNTVV